MSLPRRPSSSPPPQSPPPQSAPRHAGEDPAAAPTSKPRVRLWRPRFTVGGMLLVMVVVCVTAAGGGYLRSATQSGASWRVFFIVFTLAAPPLLLSVLSILRLVFSEWSRPRRARQRRARPPRHPLE